MISKCTNVHHHHRKNVIFLHVAEECYAYATLQKDSFVITSNECEIYREFISRQQTVRFCPLVVYWWNCASVTHAIGIYNFSPSAASVVGHQSQTCINLKL